MITTVVIAVVALVGGLVVNWLLKKRRRLDTGEALTIRDLSSPMETLAVLLLAFVLVVAAESYSAAEEAVRVEANVVDNFFEVAEFAPQPAARTLQGATVCYARAVLAHEWPSLEDGGGGSSKPSTWSTQFRAVFKEIGADNGVFETLVQADRDRSDARSQRIAQATPAIPAVLYWFMVLSLAVMVVAFAFNLPARGKRAEVVGLVVLTTLVTLSLLLIRDVDRPFGGAIGISPEAMAHTEADIAEDFADAYGQNALPCDAEGNRRES
ncbi:bestrophin-like domain [Saccharothrix variisporea]|uniref:Uncharacterized protein DUF4239 n=1 Tax=Saccharothrix variisporea TaxID=543527 RepID=A0A495XIZ3_9PSEU|nr:DUF4239 domain-containing protein [Saccharothrix variisporea]RKT73952.1 uncharacterized protein DUF4239 [Saccharothrix variisporea]